MRLHSRIAALIFTVGALSIAASALAQGSPGDAPPPDPWPRGVDLGNAQVLVYQPQINSWTDNQLNFRAALAIKPTGAKAETINDTGAITECSPAASRQAVLIDKESLPTGMVMPNVAQSSTPTARTVA